MADIYSNRDYNSETNEIVKATWINTITQIIGNPSLLSQFPVDYQQEMIAKVVKATSIYLDNDRANEKAESLPSKVIF